MEIIKEKRKVPKYVEVESDEYETVIIYKTSDGQTFKDTNSYYTKNAKQLAQQHEDSLTFDKVERKDFELVDFEDVFYKADNQEELDAVKRHFSTWGNVLEEDEIRPGEWFTYYYDYGGDSYPDKVTLMTMNFVLSNLGEFLALFGKKIVDK